MHMYNIPNNKGLEEKENNLSKGEQAICGQRLSQLHKESMCADYINVEQERLRLSGSDLLAN